jgi:hypothetical protein
VSPEDEYYSSAPPPTHTPYPYNGGNSGAQQQQRPFGVEQNPTEDRYIFDSSTVVGGQLFEEDECRPSGKTTRYIGVGEFFFIFSFIFSPFHPTFQGTHTFFLFFFVYLSHFTPLSLK